MMKKVFIVLRDSVVSVFVFLFTLIAAPIIHLSGLNKADCGPAPEEIAESQRFAEELKRKYKK